MIEALLADPAFEWRDASVTLVGDAVDRWLSGYPDQRFSLTDAVTFEIMRLERVDRAFAYDQDFVTAGFTLLE